MIKFGSIEQFKNTIKKVRDFSAKYGKPIPTLKFVGTTKLHGTNASVVCNPDGTHTFQSRERELSITSDNAGFCMWGMRNIDSLQKTIDWVTSSTPVNPNESIVIFGEWCGPGVQKGVAISEIPHKIFVIFNITIVEPIENVDENGVIVDTKRRELPPELIKEAVFRTPEIYSIYDFPTWELDIDFNAPQLSQNKLVELTLAVEEECPVGKQLGVSGVGEGIVWWNPEVDLTFKVKGKAHSVSKVRTIKEIAAVDIERMNSIKEFVDTVITENRLNQGLAKLGEMGLDIEVKNTGTFMKWVVSDGIKEEMDVIIASNFDMKEIGKIASDVAKAFWFKTLEKVE